jgi:putative ABC transport system substrate-binding protein
MRRRNFIKGIAGSAAAWPLVARAQQSAKIPIIGFLGLAPEFSGVQALRAGLRDLGYIEGRNVIIVWQWAGKVEQLPGLAAELVALPVDVIFAPSSTFVEAARKATSTIPIVFAVHADPVGLGHVASLAQPGGNITGMSMLLTELAAKGLEVMTETVPQLRRLGILWNPTTPSHPRALKAIEAAGEKLGVELRMVPSQTLEDFDGAFSTMKQEAVDGLLAVASPLIVAQAAPLAGFALKHRLPGMFSFKENV